MTARPLWASRGGQDAVAKIPERGDHGGPDILIVLDHENGLGSALGRARGNLCVLFLVGKRARQVDLDRRALAGFAVDLDVAAGLLDEAVDHGEAKPGALAFGLGGKEWLEHLLKRGFIHAGTGIGDCKQHVIAAFDVFEAGGVGVVEPPHWRPQSSACRRRPSRHGR
jgi:hypothetical protein